MRWLLREQGLPLRSVAAASAMVFAMSACAGTAAAPKTVGPTAGEDEPSVTYEPATEPFTSEVELSAADEADIQELIELIEQFTLYTTSGGHIYEDGIRSMEANLDSGLFDAHIESAKESKNENIYSSGSIIAVRSTVEDYQRQTFAVVSTCYDLSNYQVLIDGPSPTTLYEDDPDFMALEIYADRIEGKWVLHRQYLSRLECNES